ncbi:extracellular solute-binding protein [Paenibacillus contaminans]|uniref:ABC transporter substrate-binding protein n=1 Tax=Paenibacillus contaminans TaxID=450362 RepID=A0A329MBJ6_9BACL|nr:extracellular solute-binding protein [Paenibacillus contaminans]RAV17310.1 hypothetical protein DQG23_27065 [Paenibacillus contaminans]
MATNKKSLQRGITLALVSAVGLTGMIGCSNGGNSKEPAGNSTSPAANSASPTTQPPLNLDIMLPSFGTESPKEDSPVIQALEKATNTKLHFEWAPNSSYGDKYNITLASGKMPAIMVVQSKTASFVNAARSGAFWELGPYLKDYPNLSKANPITLKNSSVDGKVYGLYRTRPLGRNGMMIRQDWLENVGLQPPKTIDDFYNVLKAFAAQDPDKNGKADTYGMVITKYNLPWEMMQTWFGAPNKWGMDANGKLTPVHFTSEYMDALRFFKKLYDEKLINQDFAVMDSAKWVEPLAGNQAGVVLGEADGVVPFENRVEEAMKKLNKPERQYLDIFGDVAGPKGIRNLPTTGYAGLVHISKSTVKTEAELKRVLTFLDKLSDADMQNLLYNGIEGRHYTKTANGIEATTDKALLVEKVDISQVLTNIPENKALQAVVTPLRAKLTKVQKDNEAFVVPDPTSPLVSTVYTQKGAQLDNIANDARTKFIVGQIDEAGLKAANELWLKSGGEDLIKEMNELYVANGK